MRKTNASIARCAFDDGATGLEKALTLGIFDDEEGGAIFD